MENFFTSRVDPIEKHWMVANGDLEFNWEYEENKKIFMSVFPGHYNFYDEVMFGTNDDGLNYTYINDKESPFYNADHYI